MNDRVERRLEQTLAGRAATIAGSRFTADDLIAAGHKTRARRRVTIAAGMMVAAVVAAATPLTTNGLLAGQPQVQQATGGPSTETGTQTPDGMPPGSAGLDVIADGQLIPHDGDPFTLGLPAGEQPWRAVRVPSGWLVETHAETTGGKLWSIRPGTDPVRIGALSGTFAVSPDGRTLVADGTVEPDLVTAYELPSLRQIRSVRVGAGSSTKGVLGDLVVTSEVSGDISATTSYTWNLDTGKLRSTDKPISVWGVTTDGRVLREVTVNVDPPVKCVDLVSIAALTPVRSSGHCAVFRRDWGRDGLVSSDGAWGVFNGPDGTLELVRTSDIRAGDWSPRRINLPPGARAVFWTTDGALVATDPATESYYHCRPLGRCSLLGTPVGPSSHVILVPEVDG
ncbi:MAG: hypothetical protein L0Y54_22505 [Sporichthyaceae bacterium]|nr:hypothetical protein [Sporichthyaceae bacterium]